MLKAGLQDLQITFLFVDTQVKRSLMPCCSILHVLVVNSIANTHFVVGMLLYKMQHVDLNDLKYVMHKVMYLCSHQKAMHQILISTFVLISQIKSESFLEDINNILNSGDVPNLYASDEQERIQAAMKPVVQDLGQQPTKANLMAAYIRRVRSNIHTVLCMRLVIR